MSTHSSSLATTDDRPMIIGINFGNSYASIAVITKEGKAECIANEDGERQIAATISFYGEEMYIGNQATPQLVKNADNTITGFRNLLGRKFSEISSTDPGPSIIPSARIIEHPSLPDTPCYPVRVLVPSPAPLISSRSATTPPTPSSRPSTQNPTPLATPCSEPVLQTRYITPFEASTIFLKSLNQSAADFLGKSPEGAVLTVPSWFTQVQRESLKAAAKESGINLLQLLEEDAAAVSVLIDEDNESCRENGEDRTTLLVDWGTTDLTVSLLSVRAGLVHVLASARAPELGTGSSGSVDEILVRHFAKEFSKKNGELLQVCPPNAASARAQTKLALALVHVKRSLTTANITSSGNISQPKSAQISVENLHGGLDFNAALNRTRTTGLLSDVFTRFSNLVRNVLDSVNEGEPWSGRGIWVDSILWVGGGGRMAAAGASLVLISSGVVGDDVREEEVCAPEEALARGCALHGKEVAQKQTEPHPGVQDVLVTRRTVGIIIPQSLRSEGLANGDAKHAYDDGTLGDNDDLGGQWMPVLQAETPLPARRTARFTVASSISQEFPEHAIFEVWEVSEVVRVNLIAQAADHSDASEDEELPHEDIEGRQRGFRKEQYLGVLKVRLSPSSAVKKGKKGARSTVEVRFDVDSSGSLDVRAREEDHDWVRITP